MSFKSSVIFDRKTKSLTVTGIATTILVRRLPINAIDSIADSVSSAGTLKEQKAAAARAVAMMVSNSKGEPELDADKGEDIDWILDNFELPSMLEIINGCFEFNGVGEKKVDSQSSMSSSETANSGSSSDSPAT